MTQPPNRDEPDGTRRFDPYRNTSHRNEPDGTQQFDPYRDDDDDFPMTGAPPEPTTRIVRPEPEADRTRFLPPSGQSTRPGDEDRTRFVPPVDTGRTRFQPPVDSTRQMRGSASVGATGEQTRMMPADQEPSGQRLRGAASVPPRGGDDDYFDHRDDDDDRPPPKSGRGLKITLIVLGIILAVMLVTMLGVYAGTQLFGSPTDSVSPSPSAPVAPSPTEAPPTEASASPKSDAKPRITSFSASPTSVKCAKDDTEKDVTLSWEVKDAENVDLYVDGTKSDSYTPSDSPTVSFPCDGKSHTYRIIAKSGDNKSKAKSVKVRAKSSGTGESGGTGGNGDNQENATNKDSDNN